ncbi:palmitoyltransferase ZDHHC11 [Pygocentrus nattereri]|uniref:Palmitoyltransferase n=1 Tax=Pygocentrus nattereri TaxID=42514 RepID=A0A3B4DMA4_PYGNA|nr:palmitoyltransferase ZDHHC11 [Pygocentrus nattereri]
MTNMSCLERRFRRTAPVRGSSRNELVTAPLHSRVNGWTLPLHVLQLLAWLMYSFMAIVGFGVYIPLLPPPWNYIAYGVIGTAFLLHLLTHLAAVTVDPADNNVQLRKDYSSPMPVFDKKKQPHVIHNQHCYLCEVDVGPKVKHCGSCNKCIADFDHHCKWLNNCVGRKNYWLFFMTVLSAVFGVLLLVVVILFIFIEHFVNPANLRMAAAFQSVKENRTWLAFLPLAPVQTSSASLLILAFITVIVALASLLMLCHLLVFHIYLLCKGMSTYEYIMKQRQLQSCRDQGGGATQQTRSEASAQSLGPLDMSIDCDAPLSSRSSIFKYKDRGQMSSELSGSICSEMEHFPQAANGENPPNYGSKASSQIIPGEASVSWRPSHVESPQVLQQSSSGRHSQAEGHPIVQSPLGTSIIDTTVVHQQLIQ